MNLRRNLTINTLDLLALSCFALAQPLFDLLSRNAEFFVARKSEPLDIFLLVLVLCLALPLGLLLLEAIVASIAPGWLQRAHSLILAVLLGITLLPILKRAVRLPGIVWLAIAIVIGIVSAVTYMHFRTARRSLAFLAPSVLIFPALFLFDADISKIWSGKPRLVVSGLRGKATDPVIMVIFDEFPLTSLLDENRQVDPDLYPNFVRLSQNATWYRNATAVSEGTLAAVPAILDGLYPRPSLHKLPTSADHPHTLFTLLGGTHQFNVVENNTRLCPEELCGNAEPKTPLRKRMRGLLSDVWMLYLYLVLPSDLTGRLPDITHSWKDFAATRSTPSNPMREFDDLTDWGDRPGVFKTFVDSIQPASKPALHFLHTLLPHAPWQYLRSGKKFTLEGERIRGAVGINDRGEEVTKWTNDQWAVLQAYQKHLLQVALVDEMLGYLLNHLDQVGLYDPALIVIAADHGVSFRTNESRRRPSMTNYAEIMSVPLFIKAPHQHEGQVTDQNIETIDILPTIADMLKIDLPWKIDGRSAFNKTLPQKKEKILITETGARLVFGSNLESKYDVAMQKLKLFGSEPSTLFKIGPHNELIGLPLVQFATTSLPAVQCDLDEDSYFNDVDFKSPVMLTQVTGRVLRSRQETFVPLTLAVAVNGTIRAMTESYREGADERFAAIIPESELHPGHNEVRISAVTTDNDRVALAEIPKVNVPPYQWGSLIFFTTEGNARPYQAEGWGRPEQYITWINGQRARLVLPVTAPTSPVDLKTWLCGFLVPGRVARQRLRVLVNHQFLGEWVLTDALMHEKTLVIPKELLAGRREMVITFETPNAVSPASLGSGSDVRELSVALSWLSMTPQKR